MRRIHRGDLRAFDPDAYPSDDPPADGMVVLTDDDWNAIMRTSTVAMVIKRDQHPDPGDPTIVDLGAGDYVDCSALQPVLHARVGDLWHPALTSDEQDRVDFGVRRHLCIDQLKANRGETAGTPTSRYGWVPEQGMVRQVEWPPGDRHMLAVISSTSSNAALGTSTGVLLTSHTKTRRKRWEVPVPGGCAVIGDVHTFNNHEINPVAQRGKPDRLSAATLALIADNLERVLGL